MPEITRDSILAGQARGTAHINYGRGRGGYSYQHVQIPRLGWIDRHGRWATGLPEREWLVDGASCGHGEAGLRRALDALKKPVETTPPERAALAAIPAEFADLRETQRGIEAALIASGTEAADAPGARLLALHYLRAKGLIEFGREELPPGAVPLPHLNWKPTVRRARNGH